MSVASTVTSARLTLGFPLFIKPSSGGGSLSAGIARNEAELIELLTSVDGEPYGKFMIEEYVPGIPCTVGLVVVDGQLQTLPVHDVETDRELYDYTAKHDPVQRKENFPSILPDPTTDHMQYVARRIFGLLGAHGVLRVDFLAAASGRTAVLEVNTVPYYSQRESAALVPQFITGASAADDPLWPNSGADTAEE